MLFNSRPDTVQRGAQLDLSAQVYDQYHMPMQAAVSYQLSADHTGREAARVEGATLSADGVLTVSEAVPAGELHHRDRAGGGRRERRPDEQPGAQGGIRRTAPQSGAAICRAGFGPPGFLER